jgi:hypothetical protein
MSARSTSSAACSGDHRDLAVTEQGLGDGRDRLLVAAAYDQDQAVHVGHLEGGPEREAEG